MFRENNLNAEKPGTDEGEIIEAVDIVNFEGTNNVTSTELSGTTQRLTVDWKSVLGVGATGTVFNGTYNKMKVAIKMTLAGDTQFENEIEIINKINSAIKECSPESEYRIYRQNIMTYYGFVRSDKLDLYSAGLISELMNGGKLSDSITGKKLSLSQVYSIAKDITSGLCFLHHYNIVHSDLKSTNILLNNTDGVMSAKIFDFGLSATTNRKLVGGSPIYMAPEVLSYFASLKGIDVDNDDAIASGKTGSDKADIYSFAIVLFEMLSQQTFEIYLKEHEIKEKLDLPALMKYIGKGNRPQIPERAPYKLGLLVSWTWQQHPEKRPNARKLLAQMATGIDTISEKLKANDQSSISVKQDLSLHSAAEQLNVMMIDTILQQHPDVNEIKSGKTPLQCAVQSRHERILEVLAVVNVLLENNATYNVSDDEDSIVLLGQVDESLSCAAQHGYYFVVKALIELIKYYNLPAAISFDRKDSLGHTPLRLAMDNGHENIVTLLREAGAETNYLTCRR